MTKSQYKVRYYSHDKLLFSAAVQTQSPWEEEANELAKLDYVIDSVTARGDWGYVVVYRLSMPEYAWIPPTPDYLTHKVGTKSVGDFENYDSVVKQ